MNLKYQIPTISRSKSGLKFKECAKNMGTIFTRKIDSKFVFSHQIQFGFFDQLIFGTTNFKYLHRNHRFELIIYISNSTFDMIWKKSRHQSG